MTDQSNADIETAEAATARVCELIGETLVIEPPGPDHDLIESELIDSLALMAVIAALEAELGARFSGEQLSADNFRTPRRIAACIGFGPGIAG